MCEEVKRRFIIYALRGSVREANTLRVQKLCVVAVGYLLEIVLVMGYARQGLSRLAHPKFRLNARRARRLAVHVALGGAELALGAMALIGMNWEVWMTRMCAVCALVHGVTAVTQIDTAFGTPSIIVPALNIMNAAHAEKAVRALVGTCASAGETALENLVDMLVLAQGFAYSRIFIFAFARVPGVQVHKYTTGATLALFLVIPTVYGPMGALLAMIAIAAYSNLYGSESSGQERDYTAVVRSNSLARVVLGKPPIQAAFDVLDTNGNGTLDKSELHEQLKLWGMSEQSVAEVFDRIDTSHDLLLTFEEVCSDEAGRRMLEYISDCLREAAPFEVKSEVQAKKLS
jgi:hypothetical protein